MLLAVSLGTSSAQEKAKYRATGGEATLLGTISFEGRAPESIVVDMSADPFCEKVNPGATTYWDVISDGKLGNVVVYVRGPMLDSYSWDAPAEAVVLEHKRCRYQPHVLGMQTGQTLQVLNSDATTHNTHVIARSNPDWNTSQPNGAAALAHSFALPETFIPIKDNQHPWEKAYVGVFSHPFFSVSGVDGSYKISGLPPGQYTVVAWHEKFGEQTFEVFLAGSEQKNLDFTFKAANRQ